MKGRTEEEEEEEGGKVECGSTYDFGELWQSMMNPSVPSG